MIRDVDLVSYLPPYMQTYKEPVAALESENPEFTLVWTAADKTLNNRFISTADEDGISRYESMLGIYPSEEDTLESRRARVQSRWYNTIPYTIRVLIQKLTVLSAGADFTLTHNFAVGYTLTLVTDLELYGQVEELEEIINTMIPCNIVVESSNEIPSIAYGYALFGGGLCFINAFTISGDFVETYTVNGSAAGGGGTVFTDFFSITGDAEETVTVNGETLSGGGLVESVILQITNDFDEAIAVSGSVESGAGIVSVDFIEITSNA